MASWRGGTRRPLGPEEQKHLLAEVRAASNEEALLLTEPVAGVLHDRFIIDDATMLIMGTSLLERELDARMAEPFLDYLRVLARRNQQRGVARIVYSGFTSRRFCRRNSDR
jgi:hypothetical protein